MFPNHFVVVISFFSGSFCSVLETDVCYCTRKLTLYLFSLFDETKTVETWTKCILSIFCSFAVPKCICIVYRGHKVVDIAERGACRSPNPRKHFFSLFQKSTDPCAPSRLNRSALLMDDVIFHFSHFMILPLLIYLFNKKHWMQQHISRKFRCHGLEKKTSRKKSKERRRRQSIHLIKR